MQAALPDSAFVIVGTAAESHPKRSRWAQDSFIFVPLLLVIAFATYLFFRPMDQATCWYNRRKKTLPDQTTAPPQEAASGANAIHSNSLLGVEDHKGENYLGAPVEGKDKPSDAAENKSRIFSEQKQHEQYQSALDSKASEFGLVSTLPYVGEVRGAFSAVSPCDLVSTHATQPMPMGKEEGEEKAHARSDENLLNLLQEVSVSRSGVLMDRKIDLEALLRLVTSLPALGPLPSLPSAALSASSASTGCQEKAGLSEETVQSNAVVSTSTTPSNSTNQETSTKAEGDVVPSPDGNGKDDTKMSTEGNTTVHAVVNVDNPQSAAAVHPIEFDTLPSHAMVEAMERDIKSTADGETTRAVVTTNSGGDVKESNNEVRHEASITPSAIEPDGDLMQLSHPVAERVTPTNGTWK